MISQTPRPSILVGGFVLFIGEIMNIVKLYICAFIAMTISTAMASDEILCEPGYYKKNNECVKPPAGNISPGGNSNSYTPCSYTKYANEDQSECIPCPPEYPYTSYYGARIEDCFNICAPGTYMESVSATKCTSVGTDAWAPLHTYYYGHDYKTDNTVHKCPGTTKTLGRIGNGANDETDCAYLLHIGDNVIRMVGKKKTSPALAILINDTTYYAQMSETKRPISSGTEQKLHIDFADKHYYAHDDTAIIRDAYPWESVDFDWAETGKHTYDTENSTWSVQLKNSTWTGIAQSRNNGTECYCKMLSPAVSDWSQHPHHANHNSCAFTCAWGLSGTPTYRANIIDRLIE